MRVLVCGGRNYGETDNDQAAEIYFAIRDIHEKTPISALIQGGARGADRCAADFAKELGIKVVTVPADWKTYGKAAGPIRNQRMIDDFKPDLVLAFPGGRGTADIVARAEKAQIPVLWPAGRELPEEKP
ncbi:MAG TPA: DUF2493 domain-containing protein [Steroidobacteraceae bacterium]|nr:DUF2493 domain-containing protein [Steroidobacteraceae bacterium]